MRIDDRSARSKVINSVVDAELCAGCGLCAGISSGAIAMRLVDPGYARPTVMGPVAPAIEARIAAACPGAVVAPWTQTHSLHPYWGPYRRVMTGHATDPEFRFAGSSGGLLSALALHALESGEVDAVAHVHADPDRPTQNMLSLSRSRAEILAGAGSRYGATSPLSTIDALLARDEQLLFIGKPCDVSALRLLGQNDPRVARRIPLMFAFFCGGMPSLKGTDRVISAMGLDPADVIRFRYRGNGWPGEARAETRNGKVGTMSYHDSWGGHLSKEVQFRCKICPDAVGGVADIACADAWYGGESGYPMFDEADGRSLLLTRSGVGDRLLDNAVTAGVCAVTDCPIGEVDLMQPGQVRRKRVVFARAAATRVTGQPLPRMRGLLVGRAAWNAGIGETARNFAGTVRRIILGRR
ncbi:MAG: Coenzyme F420 hydrogenase/dehydrogenase, beta subunit C-terminal domain [Sphingopyxis sp.]|uniref:Coenzyme F420 hydrogenase/dehydrogenase, beta subunit C-terminal domain n=1 Tax=Sphingopyxis sp. TaxID=1908224 RepID=UPI002ABA40B4|nr:Coenzyme F420 hydrogenase/dehydrogenase, beta subunit C-terminal domain [Sphingopyxis sp.]MDZ3833673.1 Coenzyme F420 hydrogenase/dehydrogenase, beta subunit C-terminal domain [Sphingopyxis sp.]